MELTACTTHGVLAEGLTFLTGASAEREFHPPPTGIPYRRPPSPAERFTCDETKARYTRRESLAVTVGWDRLRTGCPGSADLLYVKPYAESLLPEQLQLEWL